MVIYEQHFRKTKLRGKRTHYFDIYIYIYIYIYIELKFAEGLYIFIQMCIAKIKNDNEKHNVCTECTKIIIFLSFLFLRVILAVCISLLFYRTSSKVLLYNVRDTCNNILIQ